MNFSLQSSHYWDSNPPPPGTEFECIQPLLTSSEIDPEESRHNDDLREQVVEPLSKTTAENKDGISSVDFSPQRHQAKSSDQYGKYRSRSRSSNRKHRRRRSSRSRSKSRRISRDRRRRSRSDSRSHSRERRRSRSRRSRSYTRRRRYSDSHSKSRSRSRSTGHYRRYRRSHKRKYSRSRSRSHKHDNYRSASRSPKVKDEYEGSECPYYNEGDIVKEEDMLVELQEPENNPIPFKNDGSFLEMFKKMQEMQQQVKQEPSESALTKKPVIPIVGKRRGGKILKTGMVQKVRNIEDDASTSSDPWSVYMKEVRKYKEAHCDDDSKTRPLVK